MTDERTHASFFSGVGGLDMGLERAGWRTVSFSEVDPYASAVLAQRWPGVPNLGDITALAADVTDRGERSGHLDGSAHVGRDGFAGGNDDPLVQPELGSSGRTETRRALGAAADRDWTRASLWTGGFPCQDLSVAGKRRGMVAGTRSGLAYSFLTLAERHRPRFVLLENVPGLLSSHGGRDMAALLGALAELGYGVGYRVLDARYFGVPQRRRRVFILGDSLGGRSGAERASEVLSVSSRCRRHPPTGVKARPRAAAGTDARADIVGSVPAGVHGFPSSLQEFAQGFFIPAVGPSSDPDGVRAADGLAGRLDDRGGVAAFAQNQRGELRTSETAFQLTTGGGKPGEGYSAVLGAGSGVMDNPLVLDSHRYRCCGNGVVADVSEWIGLRLAELT